MAADPLGIAVPRTEDLVALRYGARHLSLFPRKQAAAPSAGNYRSHFRGRGMDFDEVRPYQPGDDIRTIDWRVTARTNRTHTKAFREERERPVLIVADLRSGFFFGSTRLKSLVATDVAATLAWAGLAANDRVGGMVFSPNTQRDTRSRRSHHVVLQLIRDLADACVDLVEGHEDHFSLEQILENTHRVASPGSSVVVISDFQDMDHHCEKRFFALARHCDLTLVRVTDPLEHELPPPGTYRVAGSGVTKRLDTRDRDLREQFSSRQNLLSRQIESAARRVGAGLLRISTREPVPGELARHYGAPGQRRRG